MSARLLKDPATASCRIFVGHLQTDDTNKLELEQHFSKYGTVIGSLINRGFGFVQFENEKAAQTAIQNENGQMFKGRRIDVRPAKKDSHNANSNSGNQNNEDKSKTQGGNQFSSKNNTFNSKNNTFGNTSNNQNFNKKNFSDTSFDDHPKSDNDCYDKNSKNDSMMNQHENDFQSFSNNDNSFNSSNHNSSKDNEKEQFNSGYGNDQMNSNADRENNSNSNSNISMNNNNSNNNNDNSNDDDNNSKNNNQNNEGNNENSSANSGNQNRQNNNNNNNNQNRNNQGNAPRQRGNRGGKNRNKNRGAGGGGGSGGAGGGGDNALNNGNNFRDRSPLNRGMRGGNDEKGRDWDHNVMMRNNNFNRDSFNENRFDDRFKDVIPSGNYNYNRDSFNGNRFDDRFKDPINTGNYPRGPSDYPPMPVSDKNDCEIIVVNKNLTEYAEAIEARLKKMCLTVDLLFPNEEVPLSRVLGNIANRGCLYAVVITPINMEHYSITLNILHGLPQEHRNMPVEDALSLISRDFSNYKSGGRSVPFNTPFASDRHPDAIQVLLNMLADNHQLTVLQYDRLIKYLEVKREEQVQSELGDTKDLPTSTALATVNDPKQAELQSRILNILNSNKTSNTNLPAPSPVPAPAPVPAPPSTWEAGVSSTTTTSVTSTSTTGVSPSPLLNDPTVQKALDSLLQGNLLKNIGDSQSTSTQQPLFAAFPNINRF